MLDYESLTSYYELPAWLEIQFFYNRLQPNTRMMVDAATGRALMGKPNDEAYELPEEMAANDFEWHAERVTPKKVAGMYELDVFSAIHAQLALLTKQLGASTVSTIRTPNLACDTCGGAHASGGCQVGNTLSHTRNEQADFINNVQCPNNFYFNT